MKDRKRHEHDSLLYRSVGQRSPNYESLSPVMMTHLRTDGFYGTMFKHHRDCGFQFSGEPTHLLHCILGSVEILGTEAYPLCLFPLASPMKNIAHTLVLTHLCTNCEGFSYRLTCATTDTAGRLFVECRERILSPRSFERSVFYPLALPFNRTHLFRQTRNYLSNALKF